MRVRLKTIKRVRKVLALTLEHSDYEKNPNFFFYRKKSEK